MLMGDFADKKRRLTTLQAHSTEELFEKFGSVTGLMKAFETWKAELEPTDFDPENGEDSEDDCKAEFYELKKVELASIRDWLMIAHDWFAEAASMMRSLEGEDGKSTLTEQILHLIEEEEMLPDKIIEAFSRNMQVTSKENWRNLVMDTYVDLKCK